MLTRVDPKVAQQVLDDPRLSPSTRTTGVKVHYIGAASTAKLVRSALRLAFPGAKFRVRSSQYSGGSSVHVHWVDGPAETKVKDALGGIVGKGFDGMIDMEYSSDCWMTRSGSIGFASTAGTEGSMGTVPAVAHALPVGAVVVVFMSYMETTRSYSRSVDLPSGYDYWAWQDLKARDLPAVR